MMINKNSKKRKIVFINQATGYLTIDIVNAFVPRFESVALIMGSIRVQDIELDGSVKLSKIIKYNRGSPLKKFSSWFIATIQIFFLLLFRYRKYEIFYITIPPTAYLLSLFLPNKFSVLVFDVYPDVLKIHNIGETSIIYKSWEKANRRVFRKARKVFTLGEGMARLLNNYTDETKLQIIPLWTGLTNARFIPKNQNPWLAEQKLENKFIVQYSGNIGYTHNVEIILDLALELKNESNIHFLIIGRGERYNHIRSLMEKNKLDNCTLLPFQPDDVLIHSLAAADLGVVLLDEKTAHVSIPSKIYNLQALSVPILGISPPGSELDKHLRKYSNGRCYRQSDLPGMAEFIIALKNDPEMLHTFSGRSNIAARDFSIRNAEKYCEAYV